MKMKEEGKGFRGSFTVEASVIVPIIFLVFSLIIMALFYFHDKNVIFAVAHETLAAGSRKADITEEEMEQYFQKRLGKKLLLFGSAEADVAIDGDTAVIQCRAKKRKMSLRVEMSMKRTTPEDDIRKRRRMEKLKEEIKEGIEEYDENIYGE